MSQWTHVAGIVRVDSILGAMAKDHELAAKEIERQLKERLGKIVEFDGDNLSHYEAYLNPEANSIPTGSEGSLEYDITWTQDVHEYGAGLSWGHVSIWGDLRSYSDPNAIFNWIVQAFRQGNTEDKLLFNVRQTAIKIDIEYQGQWFISSYDDDKGNTIFHMNRAE